MKPVKDFLVALSTKFGTGDVQGDTVLLCFALTVMAFLVVLVGYLRARGGRRNEGFDRVAGILGRIEKLEMHVNSLRTDSMRAIEILKGQFGYLSQELEQLKSGKADGQQGGGGGASSLEPRVSGTPTAQLDQALLWDLREDNNNERRSSTITELGANSEIVAASAARHVTASLSVRLGKTRKGIFDRLKGLFSSKPLVDQGMLDELEAQLVSSDLGIRTVQGLISAVRAELSSGTEISQSTLVQMLKTKITQRLNDGSPGGEILPLKGENGPKVILMVGVNGVGKTTTCAKLAAKFTKAGSKVLLVAADTFRAAAVEQLLEWGRRINVPVVCGPENGKPQAVVFDAMARSKAEGFDVLIIDTAGRLHNKGHLMQELEGIKNMVSRHQAGAPQETILVVDGATGLNAVSQAREFNQATPLTGVIVTKLDGTPKGGVVVAIKEDVGIPVRYIGVGEGEEDLRPFIAHEFVDALLDESEVLLEETKTSGSAHANVRRRRREGGELLTAII